MANRSPAGAETNRKAIARWHDEKKTLTIPGVEYPIEFVKRG